MEENELAKKILWTNPGGQRGRDRRKSRWIDGAEEDARNWVVEIGWRMSRIEVTGDICLTGPRRPPRAVEPMMMMMTKIYQTK